MDHAERQNKEKTGVDIQKVLDQVDEIVYISDLDTYELLYLNRYGCEFFGAPTPGTMCYKHLQGKDTPCEFCTNDLLRNSPDGRYTWNRKHPQIGNFTLHDCLIDYNGKTCRMELAFDVNHYISELRSTRDDLSAEKKLVACIENLIMATDFDVAVNVMLKMINEHYAADRAYIFEFDWEHGVTNNTYEICKEGVTPQIDLLQNVPVDVVALWVDLFKNQKNAINIIDDVDALKDDPARRIEYDCLHPQGIKSLITVPIFLSGGKLHGFLGVDNPSDNVEAPEFLSQVTYIAANELQKHLLTEELTFKSYHDSLTKLKNRLAYDETLESLLGTEEPTGVCFIDLNGLKWLNDNLGYDMGNKAIQQTCELIRKHISDDYIYRINGDEFVIIWPDVSYSQFMETAEKLKSTLSSKQNIAAVGYVWGSEEDVGITVRKAEKAMQAAKNKFYTEHANRRDQRPAYLDALLQEFRESTFVPYLQPLYSIKEDRVYGAEVLVRKIDPRGNIHTPVEFISIMEREHMISMVDFTMLRQACNIITQRRDVWPDLVLNINFSKNTLTESDFLEHVDQILADTGVDHSQLIFEVTESSQDIQLDSLTTLLSELRKRGIATAIDDFGTKDACLRLLYVEQFKVVKLDRSLICMAENSKREQIVIKKIVELCHELDMLCVAEGIETDSQIELLKKLGCDRLQGYKIGKPMPAEDFFSNFHPNGRI